MFYSLIIPLYNRPDEIDELLDSLTKQTYKNFEVLVVEDGSMNDAREIVESYMSKLDVRYFFKPNSKQGFTRNYGFERAEGDYFIVFDSDCIIPPHYLQAVNDHLEREHLDAFGGPDAAHESFTKVQKAINYSMTSYFTTGGIRGKKKTIGPYHPRSFNMGISREVWETTGGYRISVKGEDIEFSIRIIDAGFTTGLIEDAYVFHKRRTDFKQFWKQLHFFGTARINIWRFYPSQLKIVHFFPSLFVGFMILSLIMPIFLTTLGTLMITFLLLFFMVIFLDASTQYSDASIGFLAVIASFIQLTAYGVGFADEFYQVIIRRKHDDQPKAFR